MCLIKELCIGYTFFQHFNSLKYNITKKGLSMRKIILYIFVLVIGLHANDNFVKLTCEVVSAQQNGDIKTFSKRQVKAKEMYLSVEYNDYKMKVLDGIIKSTWLGTGVYDKTKNGFDYYNFKEQPLYRDSKGDVKLGKSTKFSLVLNPKSNVIYIMLPDDEGIVQLNFHCNKK